MGCRLALAVLVSATHCGERRELQKPQAPVLSLTLKVHPTQSLHGSLGRFPGDKCLFFKVQ